mgnify:CR=1 FL=1
MDIAIYYQSGNAKEKNSHTLLGAGSSSVRTGECTTAPGNTDTGIYGAEEKPRFQNTESIHFSISHSGAWWSCAVSTEEIGLDIQQEQHCRAERLARRFIIRWKWHGWRKWIFAFCKLWAYKESYVKYTGVGLIQGMDYFSVISPSGILTGAADVCQQLVDFQQDCHMVVTAEHRQAFSLQPLEG